MGQTRNRALRAIESLVAAKERAVIDRALDMARHQTVEELADSPIGAAVLELIEISNLLAEATGTAPAAPPVAPNP